MTTYSVDHYHEIEPRIHYDSLLRCCDSDRDRVSFFLAIFFFLPYSFRSFACFQPLIIINNSNGIATISRSGGLPRSGPIRVRERVANVQLICTLCDKYAFHKSPWYDIQIYRIEGVWYRTASATRKQQNIHLFRNQRKKLIIECLHSKLFEEFWF